MKTKIHYIRGFSLIELSIVLAVLVIFSGAILLNLKTLKEINQAKECSRNLFMIKQAVNNYCQDNSLPYGTAVQVSDLYSHGYLNSNDFLACPANNTPYQNSFTYGVNPVCPNGIANHTCSE